MPTLPKASYETVAQALAAGKTQREAYLAAGYSYRPANAHRLCTSPAIAARVDEAWIFKRLKYLTDVSLQGRPIKLNGLPTGENTKPDGPTAVKCLTLAA